MTDFADLELSAEGGCKVELYEFYMDNGEVWYATNNLNDLVIEDKEYLSLAIGRSSIKKEDEKSQNELKVTLPITFGFVPRLIATLPASTIGLILKTFHFDADGLPSGIVVMWTGSLLSSSFQPPQATLNFQNTLTSLEKPGLRRKFSPSCPAFVYDDQCGLSFDEWATDVMAISTFESEIVVEPDDFAVNELANGLAYFNGQWRMIVSNGVGGRITLILPFDGSPAGQTVRVAKGCPRTMAGCVSFGNQLRFGGFPYIPVKNIFESGVS